MISIKFVRAIKFLQAEMSGRAPGSTQARELRTDRGFHPSSSGGGAALGTRAALPGCGRRRGSFLQSGSC